MATADKFIDLFNEAKAKAAGVEREHFLADACGDDSELRNQILSLLQAEAEEGDSDFLKNTPLLRQTVLVTEKPGDRIGRYKLLQQLGEGGCGVVYMAEQEEPVRRRVALKVIKLGMDTMSVIARFEAERQALALMDHPNIAKVFDAGATETGRPFFVMELVRGIKITDYCDQNNLSTEQRLELFTQVCHAVQHAHQKGIIHRDLKPSNILVTLHDGVPVPKVIDFGIAKATSDQRLTDKTVFTAFEQFIGTPAYMSPEQAEMSGLDIDTRSDIYSLGVLLYELLTGKTPLDPGELLRSGMNEMRRKIREEEPPRPSNRLSTMRAADLTTIAQHRQADAPKLIHLVHGDLDWIVMKCLEKDRTRRYETASGLAMDLKRHLSNEPVTARPPSRAYQFQKLVRRNRLVFAAAGAVAVALALGLGISTWQYIQKSKAEHEQIRLGQQAQSANRQLTESVRLLELQRAEGFFRNGDAGTAVAHLAAMLRHDSSNQIAASRLISALVHRNWALRTSSTMQHTDRVETISFSPNGRQVLSASRDQTAKIWDAGTGKLVAVLQHTGQVLCAHYDSSGARIVTACADGTGRIWDSTTGEPRTPALQHTGKVYWAEFSADDRWVVTASADTTARIWDASSGALKHVLRKHTSHVILARFSPNGKRVATGGSHASIRIWNADSGEMLFRVEDRSSPLTALAFSPDGTRLLSVCLDGIVRLWNLETRTEIDLPLGNEPVDHAAFSPDSRLLLTSSHDATARFWDVNTGQPIGAPLWHDGRVTSGQFSFDGQKVVTLSKEHSARIWDVRTRLSLSQPIRAREEFTQAELSRDGSRLVTAGREGAIHIWKIQPRRFAGLETRFEKPITSVAFNSNGESLLAASFDGTARVLDARTFKTLSLLPHEAGLYLAEFSPDGNRVFTASTNGKVRLWDWRKGVVVAGPFQHPARILSVRFNPRGDRMLTGAIDGTARVWDAATWQPITPPVKHQGPVLMARFSPDGRMVVSASEDHTARVWDAATGEVVIPPLLHKDHVKWADFSPDGKKIVTASTDNTACVWDLLTGRPAIPPIQHARIVEMAHFSPEGGRVITASLDRTARIWDVRTGGALTPPLKHDYALVGAWFSPDGEAAVTACWNGAVRAWDSKTGQPLTESLEAGGWFFRRVAFDTSGRAMATGGADSILRLWHIPSIPTRVPEWFLTFTESVAGIRLGDRGQLELVPETKFEATVKALQSKDKDDFYGRLAPWFLADPTDREPAPF